MNKLFTILIAFMIFSCDKKVSIKVNIEDRTNIENFTQNTDFDFLVKFDNISSLTKGNDVIYSGLLIGEVKEVSKIGGTSSSEIAPIVTLSIKDEYEDMLYKDAVFTIKSPVFAGDYWVEVSRGMPRSQDKILRGEILEGVTEINPSKLPELITSNQMETFSTELVSLLNPATTGDLIQSITNIRETTLKAKTLTDKFSVEGKRTKTLNETMKNLSKMSSELEIVLDKIENGQGALGKLINDSSLYDSIDGKLKAMEMLIKNLSEDPTLIKPSIWK